MQRGAAADQRIGVTLTPIVPATLRQLRSAVTAGKPSAAASATHARSAIATPAPRVAKPGRLIGLDEYASAGRDLMQFADLNHDGQVSAWGVPRCARQRSIRELTRSAMKERSISRRATSMPCIRPRPSETLVWPFGHIAADL